MDKQVPLSYQKKQLANNLNELTAVVRAPLIDKIVLLNERVTILEATLLRVLSDQYTGEFEIINGLSQHPAGLTFGEWLISKSWEIEQKGN